MHTHEPSSSKKHSFIGRESDISAIRNLLDFKNPSLSKLLITSPLAGVGKTELLKQLTSSFPDYPQTEFIYLDLAALENLDYPQFLGALRDCLHNEHLFDFPKFDLFYPLLLKSTHRDLEVKSVELGDATDLLSAAIGELSDSLSLFKTGLTLKKAFDTLKDHIAYQKHDLKSYLKQITSPASLKSTALQIFIDDVQVHFQKSYHGNYVPFVVTLDNYHYIQKFSAAQQELFDIYITQFTEALPNFFFILALTGTPVSEADHILRPLTEADTIQLLESSKIDNPTLQKAIFNATGGIPDHIITCIEAYLSLDQATQDTLDPAYFNDLIASYAHTNWHTAILKHPQAMKLLSLPNFWTKELFCATFPADIISSALDFQYLCSLPFMKTGTQPGHYELTPSMRDYLSTQLTVTDEVTYYHKHFFHFYIDQLRQIPSEEKSHLACYFTEALHHLCAQYDSSDSLGKYFWYNYKTHLQPYYIHLLPPVRVSISQQLTLTLASIPDFPSDLYLEVCCQLAEAYNTTLEPESALQTLEQAIPSAETMDKVKILYAYTLGNTYGLLENAAAATEHFIEALDLLIPSLTYTGDYLTAMDMLSKILLSIVQAELTLPLERYTPFITAAEARVHTIDRIDYRLSYWFQLANVYYTLARYYDHPGNEHLTHAYATRAHEYFAFYVDYLHNNYDASTFNEDGQTEHSLAYIRASIGFVLSLQMIEDDQDEVSTLINSRYAKILVNCQKVLGTEHPVTQKIQTTLSERQQHASEDVTELAEDEDEDVFDFDLDEDESIFDSDEARDENSALAFQILYANQYNL